MRNEVYHKEKQLGSRTAEVWDCIKTMGPFRRFSSRVQRAENFVSRSSIVLQKVMWKLEH